MHGSRGRVEVKVLVMVRECTEVKREESKKELTGRNSSQISSVLIFFPIPHR